LAALHLQRAREGGGWEDYLTSETLARHSLSRRLNRNGATAVTLVNGLLAQHRFTEARDVAADLVHREFDIPEYRALLGEVSMELGDDAVADAMFKSVWEFRNQVSMAPRIARWLELTNHVREARKLLTAARDEAVLRRNVANETKAWFNLRVGDLELRAGNLHRAGDAYRAGLRLEPGDPRLFAAMARLAMANDRPRDAIAWGERAIGLQLDPATLGLVGDAYDAIGDHAKAQEYLSTLDVAVASQPGAYHRAWALYLLDHNMRVDTVVSKAADELRDRRDVYGYDLMAWAYYKAGRPAESAVMMQRALRFNTPDPLLAKHAAAIGIALAVPNAVAAH
jgi:tetratricopeptide (TPR) repeat protein